VFEFTDEVKQVLEQTEIVTIGTSGPHGVHLVATWGDFIRNLGVQEGELLLIPAGGYRRTEENLHRNPRLEVLIGSKPVGTGFRLSGSGEVQTSGKWFDLVKAKYAWARGALVIRVDKAEKLL
jgi:hypothetical protein